MLLKIGSESNNKRFRSLEYDWGQNGPTDSCFYQFLMYEKTSKKIYCSGFYGRNFFFCHENYLLGYEIIDFEGILDAPFFYS